MAYFVAWEREVHCRMQVVSSVVSGAWLACWLHCVQC